MSSPHFAMATMLLAAAFPSMATSNKDDPRLPIGDIVDIPALSYMKDGIISVPQVNLTDLHSVLTLQELIGNQSCDCTSSGYSGVMIANDGAMATYGNTTFVGCAAHQNDELSPDIPTCYVVGGTECPDAKPSVLGDKITAFTMAAWRECNPLSSKSFGGISFGESSYNPSWPGFTLSTQSYAQYRPPACSFCFFQPACVINNYCINSGYVGGSAAVANVGGASAATTVGGASAVTAVGGASAATAVGGASAATSAGGASAGGTSAVATSTTGMHGSARGIGGSYTSWLKECLCICWDRREQYSEYTDSAQWWDWCSNDPAFSYLFSGVADLEAKKMEFMYNFQAFWSDGGVRDPILNWYSGFNGEPIYQG